MPNSITLKIADLIIDTEYNSKRIPDLCRDYIVSGKEPDIKVVYDSEKCAKEAGVSKFGETAAESSSIYRQIAERLPFYSRAVMHGAAVSFGGKAYMFIAKSGTGKTTHINLWRRYFDGVDIINGDKPIIASNGETVTVYGTPWAGKEQLQKNTSAPLAGLCVIKRGNENSIEKTEKNEVLKALLRQVYMPENVDNLNLTMKIIDDIIRLVPVYTLTCNITKEAAECSFYTLTAE